VSKLSTELLERIITVEQPVIAMDIHAIRATGSQRPDRILSAVATACESWFGKILVVIDSFSIFDVRNKPSPSSSLGMVSDPVVRALDGIFCFFVKVYPTIRIRDPQTTQFRHFPCDSRGLQQRGHPSPSDSP
jgi:hypothetical protein